MKRLIFFIFTVLISLHYGFSQEIPDGAVMIDENTIIKDEAGKKVDLNKLTELMNTGDWTMDPVEDKKGKVIYMQLRKASEEEKKMMAEMSMPENGPDLIGKTVASFDMKDLEGNRISLENTKGKVVVLNFWFAACKPCIAEIPELNKVYEKYKNNSNVVFASITFEKREKVIVFLAKHQLKYPVVSDAKEICKLLHISGYPTNIVIDKNGQYYDYISGSFPEIGHQISSSIENALENKKPLLKIIPTDGIMIDPTSTFKLENGDIVKPEKVLDILNSNKYDIIPKTEKGKEFYLLKEK